MHLCVPKELPVHLREDAARIAAFHNPANAPVRGLAAFVPAERIAILNSTYWGAKGVDLGVTFLDSKNSTLKNKILGYANKWGQYGNVKFRESGDGQVRLALKGDGYWSYIGTDILSIPKGDPTMTLDGFSLSTPDSEYDRVVCHEFGHTLGFVHEHQRAEIVALLDVEKTVAWFQQNVGWDRTTTMQQVFAPIPATSITATAPDVVSIMCYQFSGACTKSGQPVLGGLKIDAVDATAVGKLYPLATDPPTPKPPEPPVSQSFTISVPQQPVMIFGQKLGYVPAHSLTGVLGSAAAGLPTVPPEVWGLIAKYGRIVVPILLANLPALVSGSKKWKDVLSELLMAVATSQLGAHTD